MKKSNWHGGKGSGRRSTQDDNKYADNWDKIFGKTEGCNCRFSARVRISFSCAAFGG